MAAILATYSIRKAFHCLWKFESSSSSEPSDVYGFKYLEGPAGYLETAAGARLPGCEGAAKVTATRSAKTTYLMQR